MSSRLLLVGGVVLTGPSWRPERLDVLVEDGVVAAVVAPGGLGRADGVRHDVSDRLVLPGLVNGHTHSHSRHARGMARDWTLETSLLHGGFLAAERREELTRLGATLTAVELLGSGCTGAFDLVGLADAGNLDGSLTTLAATAAGHAAAGLRAVVAPMLADRTVAESLAGLPEVASACGGSGAGAGAAAGAAARAPGTDDVLAVARAWVGAGSGAAGVDVALAPTIPAQCSPRLLEGLRDLAVAHDVRLHTHLAESQPQADAARATYGRSVTGVLADAGLLGSGLTAAHAVWVDGDDLALLADAGAVLVTVPGSNLRLGSGVADVRAMLAAGLTVGVGTDGANSADAYDQLDAARLTALLCRATRHPASAWLTPAEVLEAATVGGAAACGWPATGRVSVGHAADLALLDLRAPSLQPPNDLANQVLTAARAADVRDVLVGGRWVLRDGAPVSVDLTGATARYLDLVADLHERATDVRRRAGLAGDAVAAPVAALRTGDRLLPTIPSEVTP